VTRLCDILCELPEPHGSKGATLCGKPQHCNRGHIVWESIAMHAKGGFYSRLASDEITTHGYRVLTSVECTTIMIAELAVTRSLGSSFD
jgi:hypothetical protein